eukprot:TRINITY_DN59116_c0_g1_i1.p1 TRINITY_DN59116_c0_g1~~TRINITY_DN59116_c0_g1_i1.p1  ORF type:complete len:676 (-),score=104.39 TRINITY_DN59116_c0_g1_i1:74-2044(-)
MQADQGPQKPPPPIRTTRTANFSTASVNVISMPELPGSVQEATGSCDEVQKVAHNPNSMQRIAPGDQELASALCALQNEIEQSAHRHIQQVQAAMLIYDRQLKRNLRDETDDARQGATQILCAAPSPTRMFPQTFNDDVPCVMLDAHSIEDESSPERTVSQRGSPLQAFDDVVPRGSSQVVDNLDASKSVTELKRSPSMKSKRHTAHWSKKNTIFAKAEILDQSWLQRFTDSRLYEWASITLILINSVFIGWQTAYMAQRALEDSQEGRAQQSAVPDEFTVMSYIFNVLFTVDLVLRWSAAGVVGFWWTHEEGITENLSWNILDVLIVAIGVLDSIFEIVAAAGSGGTDANEVMGNFSATRVLRIVRIVKVARVIRVMKFFRELRMMVYSIFNSLKSLVWVCLVLIILLYLFAITFTAGVSNHLDSSEKWLDPANSDLVKYFGTLERSFVNLYMAMSGGNDWTVYYDELAKMGSMYHYLFLIFITFAIFAVVNIVTGVFVDSALQSNTTDASMLVQEELEIKKAKLAAMNDVFQNLDEDGTGAFTIDEFEQRLRDERVQAYFSTMKLDVGDAKALFRLLDYDQSNEITIDEFVAGCAQLQGEARSLDAKIMQFELKWLKEAVTEVFQVVRNLQHVQEATMHAGRMMNPAKSCMNVA